MSIGRFAAVVCDCWPRDKHYPAEFDYEAEGICIHPRKSEIYSRHMYTEFLGYNWYVLAGVGRAVREVLCSGTPRQSGRNFKWPAPTNQIQCLPSMPYYAEDTYRTLLKVTDWDSYAKASSDRLNLELSPEEALQFYSELDQLRLDLDGSSLLDERCVVALRERASHSRLITLRQSATDPRKREWYEILWSDDEIESERKNMLELCEKSVELSFPLRFTT